MIDSATLQAALIGYQSRLDDITAKMVEIRKTLHVQSGGGDLPGPFVRPEKPVQKRRKLSAAARKRISAAQRKRWREFHRKQKAES